MKCTIDAAGRLVIPKQVRREAGLHPGMPLEVRWLDGRIEIEPAPVDVDVVRRGRLTVAVPRATVPALRGAAVEDVRRRLRRSRRAPE